MAEEVKVEEQIQAEVPETTTPETPDVTPPSAEVEPVLFEEPKQVQTPTPEPVKIEAEKEEPKLFTEPEKEVKVEAEVQPEETPEQFKAREQDTLNKFDSLMKTGSSSEELASFVNANPEFRDEFNIQFKNNFQNKTNFDFVQKYGTESPENLYQAVQRSEVIVGSKKYNMLPAETRQRYETYQAQQNIKMSSQEKKDSLSNDLQLIQGTEQQTPVFYGVNLQDEYNKLFNSPEITQKQAELEPLNEELANLADELDQVRDDIIEANPGTPLSLLRAQISNSQRAIQKQYDSKLNTYNAKLATLQDLKDDANTQLGLVQYQNEQARQDYQIKLQQYNTDRSRMDTFAMFELEQQSQFAAEQRSRDFTLFMTELDNKYKLENKSPVYQLGRDGQMYAIIDGQAEVVKSDLGPVLFGDESDLSTRNIYQNDDGTITEIVGYKDGRSTEVKTYDLQGNLVSGVPGTIQDIFSKCQTTGQCGAGVNDYLQNLGLPRVMGDSYESKKKNINSQVPAIGGVAIWNPNQGQGNFSEFGHTGVVTGINTDGTVQITDWNWKGDEKQMTHNVKLSEITFNGGFYNPIGTVEGGYEESNIPLYSKYNQGKLTSADIKTIDDFEEFKQEATLYGKESAKLGYQKIQDMISLAESLKGLGPIERRFPDVAVDMRRLLDKAGMQELVSLKQSGATFGSLTEKEFERIQNSIISVGALTSADKWDSILDDYITTLERGLPEEYVEQTGFIQESPSYDMEELKKQYQSKYNDITTKYTLDF